MRVSQVIALGVAFFASCAAVTLMRYLAGEPQAVWLIDGIVSWF
jgi:hypothetical protein